ncbi:hypothetical protein Tco_0678548 [Tanacetum coccineum]|uniref:Uncharacterized protein n=1 Tax=Tanacetum coccineum TaxID=301880 RepID=A0ABQ4XFD4_9ASTR
MRVQGVADSDMSKPARGKEKIHSLAFALLVLESLTWSIFLEFFKVRPCREDKCPNRREYQRFKLWLLGGSVVRRINSSVRRYVADPVNAYPKRSITKLILKGAVIFDVVSYQFRCALNYSKLLLKLLNQEYVARIRGKLIQKLLLNQKCMGYLVRAYYSISPTKYYKDDSCWSADLKSNTTEDVISI